MPKCTVLHGRPRSSAKIPDGSNIQPFAPLRSTRDDVDFPLTTLATIDVGDDNGDVALCETTGAMSVDELQKATEEARRGCGLARAFMRGELERTQEWSERLQ